MLPTGYAFYATLREHVLFHTIVVQAMARARTGCDATARGVGGSSKPLMTVLHQVPHGRAGADPDADHPDGMHVPITVQSTGSVLDIMGRTVREAASCRESIARRGLRQGPRGGTDGVLGRAESSRWVCAVAHGLHTPRVCRHRSIAHRP